MATKTKIKIVDNIELRKTLDDEYEKSSQKKLCKYALLLATHILTMIDYDDMNNPIITDGYAVKEKANAFCDLYWGGTVHWFFLKNIAVKPQDSRFGNASRQSDVSGNNTDDGYILINVPI